MSLYEELKRRKSEGEPLAFEDITESELMELYRNVSDSVIAELYDVTEQSVTARRRDFGITLRRVALETMLGNPARNRQSRERVSELGVPSVAAAVARFSLQEVVPHAPQELHEQVSKRLTYALTLLRDERWQELEFLVQSFLTDDDVTKEITPDDGGIREAVMNTLLQSAAAKDRRK